MKLNYFIAVSVLSCSSICLAKAPVRKVAQEGARPERPATLVAKGALDATTLKNIASAGSKFCKALESIHDQGVMSKPNCQKTIDSAMSASEEFCDGEKFAGFQGFNEIESATLHVIYTKLIGSDFALGLTACGHPFASTAQVPLTFASTNSQSYFGAGNGGTFDSSVKIEGGADALAKVRAEWNVYTRSLYDFLKQ